MRATVAARLVRPFLSDDALSAPVREVLAKFGLSPPDLDVPDARVDHELMVELVELAVHVTGNEQLGLYGAMTLGTSMFHILDYVARASGTVFEALQALARYNKLLHDGFRLRIEPQGPNWIVTLGLEAGLRFPPALTEFCMASLFLSAYRMGLPTVEARVFFTHPEPRDLSAYADVFRVPVHFSAPDNYVILPGASLQMRLPEADPVLLTLLEGHAEGLIERLHQATPWTALTRRLLTDRLRRGDPNLNVVARELRLSSRTLRRRLMAEGTTFQRILDDLRRELALSYLEQPHLAVEEVAFLLGFSEASAFRRAFQRWTGSRLADHRRK
jgi:AraC-like DNA-binding protein